ncbi:UNVERIFIED_CONTAM: hypothetical protein FKN15_073111 [Acipenser sinensis]
MTVLQEPVQAAVWHALNHYAYRDAVFLAERLYAEVHSEEALFLLATCYYRSGKAYKAYRLLKGHSCTTPQCKYLLAKCCVDLSRLAEGEQILTGGVLNKQKSHDDIVTEFGDSACFTLSLLGQIYCKTDRLAKGSECYQKSLTLNPFLWSPFESLCEIDVEFQFFVLALSAKENSKKLKMKFPTKIPNRKTKTKTKGGITQSNMNDSIEILKLDSSIISEGKSNIATPQVQAFNIQKAAADGLMNLMRDMGKGYLALCSYNCKEAIGILSQLPSHHYNTGWVLCQIGRAHFELAEYMQAERIFSEVRRIESYRVEGMEIYSTTLWHLQKDVALSALSKDLTDMDKNSPEAWCVAGNCFSLQREHDIAIKFFQRAIQVDPGFAYAYTLLGHEFVLTEELEKALACFRNAIRVNSRHYNAWYGLGMIYYKQEKFSLAEIHFKKALGINPQSSVLLCHIGVVQHALKKSEHALETLNKAISIDPKNPLCKFHRASILFANEKYKAALQELEELKQIVPKESLVYFLIGKVYKKLGQTHLALMNFSWAMDLDPKGANNQIKEAIDKRYLPDDEEPVTQEDSYPFESVEAEESQESSMTDADDTQLHAAESDEVY